MTTKELVRSYANGFIEFELGSDINKVDTG